MDTNKMRDTYEAWAIQDAASVGRTLVIDRAGDWYLGKDAQFLNLGWASWQASREAVVVELPAEDPLGSGQGDCEGGLPSFEQHCASECNGILFDCRIAIEAQGLKVKS